MYNSTVLWRVGLQSLSLSSGLYRWANGKIAPNPLWANNFTVHGGVEVLVPKDDYSQWQAHAIGEYAFMCEKGQDVLDYLGCYNGTGAISDFNTTSDQMTIQQCVEWCRGGGKLYAFLWFRECACSDVLPEHAGSEAYCYTRCAGQHNQVCGGSGLLSVYNICKQTIVSFLAVDIAPTTENDFRAIARKSA